jgi:hypothetical protein
MFENPQRRIKGETPCNRKSIVVLNHVAAKLAALKFVAAREERKI